MRTLKPTQTRTRTRDYYPGPRTRSRTQIQTQTRPRTQTRMRTLKPTQTRTRAQTRFSTRSSQTRRSSQSNLDRDGDVEYDSGLENGSDEEVSCTGRTKDYDDAKNSDSDYVDEGMETNSSRRFMGHPPAPDRTAPDGQDPLWTSKIHEDTYSFSHPSGVFSCSHGLSGKPNPYCDTSCAALSYFGVAYVPMLKGFIQMELGRMLGREELQEVIKAVILKEPWSRKRQNLSETILAHIECAFEKSLPTFKDVAERARSVTPLKPFPFLMPPQQTAPCPGCGFHFQCWKGSASYSKHLDKCDSLSKPGLSHFRDFNRSEIEGKERWSQALHKVHGKQKYRVILSPKRYNPLQHQPDMPHLHDLPPLPQPLLTQPDHFSDRWWQFLHDIRFRSVLTLREQATEPSLGPDDVLKLFERPSAAVKRYRNDCDEWRVEKSLGLAHKAFTVYLREAGMLIEKVPAFSEVLKQYSGLNFRTRFTKDSTYGEYARVATAALSFVLRRTQFPAVSAVLPLSLPNKKLRKVIREIRQEFKAFSDEQTPQSLIPILHRFVVNLTVTSEPIVAKNLSLIEYVILFLNFEDGGTSVQHAGNFTRFLAHGCRIISASALLASVNGGWTKVLTLPLGSGNEADTSAVKDVTGANEDFRGDSGKDSDNDENVGDDGDGRDDGDNEEATKHSGNEVDIDDLDGFDDEDKIDGDDDEAENEVDRDDIMGGDGDGEDKENSGDDSDGSSEDEDKEEERERENDRDEDGSNEKRDDKGDDEDGDGSNSRERRQKDDRELGKRIKRNIKLCLSKKNKTRCTPFLILLQLWRQANRASHAVQGKKMVTPDSSNVGFSFRSGAGSELQFKLTDFARNTQIELDELESCFCKLVPASLVPLCKQFRLTGLSDDPSSDVSLFKRQDNIRYLAQFIGPLFRQLQAEQPTNGDETLGVDREKALEWIGVMEQMQRHLVRGILPVVGICPRSFQAASFLYDTLGKQTRSLKLFKSYVVLCNPLAKQDAHRQYQCYWVIPASLAWYLLFYLGVVRPVLKMLLRPHAIHSNLLRTILDHYLFVHVNPDSDSSQGFQQWSGSDIDACLLSTVFKLKAIDMRQIMTGIIYHWFPRLGRANSDLHDTVAVSPIANQGQYLASGPKKKKLPYFLGNTFNEVEFHYQIQISEAFTKLSEVASKHGRERPIKTVNVADCLACNEHLAMRTAEEFVLSRAPGYGIASGVAQSIESKCSRLMKSKPFLRGEDAGEAEGDWISLWKTLGDEGLVRVTAALVQGFTFEAKQKDLLQNGYSPRLIANAVYMFQCAVGQWATGSFTQLNWHSNPRRDEDVALIEKHVRFFKKNVREKWIEFCKKVDSFILRGKKATFAVLPKPFHTFYTSGIFDEEDEEVSAPAVPGRPEKNYEPSRVEMEAEEEGASMVMHSVGDNGGDMQKEEDRGAEERPDGQRPESSHQRSSGEKRKRQVGGDDNEQRKKRKKKKTEGGEDKEQVNPRGADSSSSHKKRPHAAIGSKDAESEAKKKRLNDSQIPNKFMNSR
ncbi:hypothetical protein D9757_007805 [Collybiopsis confluens]|uniref:Uncharacterized protein n=1 Tax=Collybiopsis confluens TaxID=2823264 RepID=A0A8H5HQ49_9AGAR|nr:hypothetical protein D9757_007805 [Collybiopsis confluens]